MLIVFVGVRGAGKTTLLNIIRDRDDIIVLQPSTNRPRRSADETEYDFVTRWVSSSYAWSIDVGGNHYGMRNAELERAYQSVCATVFDPASIDVLSNFRRTSKIEIVTVGLDTIQNHREQAARIENDASRTMGADEFETARRAVLACDVVLRGPPEILLAATNAVIRILGSRGGMLVKEDIKKLIAASSLIEDADPIFIRSASYDLRIGSQVWCQGKLYELTDGSPTFDIPPYSYAIVVAKEVAAFPTFVTGTFDIKVSLFLNGVVLSNGPQVDPGYRGQLFCMLFNGGGAPRPIIRDRHFATIEFCTTTSLTEAYHEQYQLQQRLEQIMGEGAIAGPGGNIIESMGKQIGTVQKEVNDIKGSIRNTIWTVAAVVVGAIAIPGTILLAMLWDRVKSAEDVVNMMKESEQQVILKIQEEGERQRSLTKMTTKEAQQRAIRAIEEARQKITPPKQ